MHVMNMVVGSGIFGERLHDCSDQCSDLGPEGCIICICTHPLGRQHGNSKCMFLLKMHMFLCVLSFDLPLEILFDALPIVYSNTFFHWRAGNIGNIFVVPMFYLNPSQSQVLYITTS